jgi:hypothetical protein
MKTIKPFVLGGLLAATTTLKPGLAAPLGTAFTYQGRLDQNGQPATGLYQMTFWVYAASSGGSPLASNTVPSVGVTSGLFSTDVDLGPYVFAGDERWLAITVATNGSSSFVLLQPRTRIAPTPNAIYASTAGTVTNGAIQAGQLGTAGAPLAGQVLTYNGSTLAWQDPATPGNAWSLGGNNTTTANFLGTLNNLPVELRANNARALRLEPNATSPNLVGGWNGNVVDPGVSGATIAGGGALSQFGLSASNRVTDSFGTIGGGAHNVAGNGGTNLTDGYYATVGGGHFNQALGIATAICGGAENQASNNNSFIGGGYQNKATGYISTVAGGNGNQAAGTRSTVGGGYSNQSIQEADTVGGGYYNLANGSSSTVGGGYQNTAGGGAATVAGGSHNIASGPLATVAGGENNTALGDHSTIGGGELNSAEGTRSVIAGGYVNRATGLDSTVGGGDSHEAFGDNSTIAGGIANHVEGVASTVGGGRFNRALTNFVTIGGGNTNAASATFDTIGGGGGNRTLQPSLGDNVVTANTIAGGYRNTAFDHGAGSIGGGEGNSLVGLNGAFGPGYGGTVPGGVNNTAGGNYSFAAGHRAKALHNGCFVWGDSTEADVVSGSPNTVIMRAVGGFSLYTGGGVGAWLPPNGTSWGIISDRNSKKNLEPVNCREILGKLAGVPVQRWLYKVEADDAVPHIGPIAQDFKAAFYPGRDDKTITTLEFDGVELAAIQGLNEIVAEKEARITGLEAEVAALKKRLDAEQSVLDRWESRFAAFLRTQAPLHSTRAEASRAAMEP